MAKSRICVEPSEVDDDTDTVLEVVVSVERQDEPDEELRCQLLVMTPAEMAELYDRMTVYYKQGIWSMKSVER